MHILIIEDEKRNFNRLKRLLEEIDGTFRIDGPLASIVEAVEWRRIVIKLCLGVDVAKSEDEEFSVVDAVEFSPESLDFRVY